MKRITLCFLLFGIFQSGLAQILNVEKFRLDKDTAKVFVGNIGFGFTSKQQRTSLFSLNSKANAGYLSKKHAYLLINTLSIVKVENADPANNGYAHLRFNFFRRKRISPEQFNQIQFDVGRGLELRKLTGASARLKLIATEKTSLAFNTGAMVEFERWLGATEIENTFIKSTSNISLEQKLLPNLNLFLITYYQARPEYFFQPRLTSDVQLQLSILKKLAFAIQFESTFDARPIIDIQKHIYTVKNNINYTF